MSSPIVDELMRALVERDETGLRLGLDMADVDDLDSDSVIASTGGRVYVATLGVEATVAWSRLADDPADDACVVQVGRANAGSWWRLLRPGDRLSPIDLARHYHDDNPAP